MMIVMKQTAHRRGGQAVVERIESVGRAGAPIYGARADRDRRHRRRRARPGRASARGQPGVDHVVPILKPYKLASSQIKHGERTVLDIGGRKVGGEHFAFIAGPCTVESREQTCDRARGARRRRALFRGRRLQAAHVAATLSRASGRRACGCSPRPSRDRATGRHRVHGRAGPRGRARGRRRPPDRRAQHAELPAAHRGRPVRPAGAAQAGLSTTLEELLMAAEYILKEGNDDVMLCERGIRTFETAYRFTLDLMAIPVLKELTHLPVIVDPSHAAGRRDFVEPMSLAAAAAGRRRDHRRGPPGPRRGDLRRPAAAACRGLRRLPATGSSASPRSPARSWPRPFRAAAASASPARQRSITSAISASSGSCRSWLRRRCSTSCP